MLEQRNEKKIHFVLNETIVFIHCSTRCANSQHIHHPCLKQYSSPLLFTGSLAVDNEDHLRLRIICGLLWESFAVLYRTKNPRLRNSWLARRVLVRSWYLNEAYYSFKQLLHGNTWQLQEELINWWISRVFSSANSVSTGILSLEDILQVWDVLLLFLLCF